MAAADGRSNACSGLAGRRTGSTAGSLPDDRNTGRRCLGRTHLLEVSKLREACQTGICRELYETGQSAKGRPGSRPENQFAIKRCRRSQKRCPIASVDALTRREAFSGEQPAGQVLVEWQRSSSAQRIVSAPCPNVQPEVVQCIHVPSASVPVHEMRVVAFNDTRKYFCPFPCRFPRILIDHTVLSAHIVPIGKSHAHKICTGSTCSRRVVVGLIPSFCLGLCRRF